MKSRLPAILTLLLVLAALLAGGIQPSASQPLPNEIRTTEKDHGRAVTLDADSLLAVRLEGNPSTGYSWTVTGLDETVLRQRGPAEFEPQSELLGAPAVQVLRFEGVARGQTTLTLAYQRPWEKAKPADTFALQVQVKGAYQGEPAPADEAAAPAAVAKTSAALPSDYNWCSLGGCTDVRDQGACGSCWAFGTVGPLESAILLQDGASKDLSEQYLVSCNTDGWGCSGGWWAHDYHEFKIPPGEPDAGAVYEGDKEYTAADDPCNGPYIHQEKIADWVYVGASNGVPPVDDIKQAILDHGPVAVAVCVNTDFQSYDGGVFNPRRPCNQTNHAVVLVGWDDSVGAWIMRNSWGPDWGESGYMRIAYNKSLVGYGANYVLYGGGTPTPTPPPRPPPPPEPTPGAGEALHVSAIDMWSVQAGRSYTVYTKVTVLDQANAPVPSATVYLQMTLPGGSTASGSAATGTDGTVTFSLKTKSTGTFTSAVSDVTHATLGYDPAANLETSETLTVP